MLATLPNFARLLNTLPPRGCMFAGSLDVDGDGNVSKDEYLATIEGDSLLYDTFTDLITVTVRGGRGGGVTVVLTNRGSPCVAAGNDAGLRCSEVTLFDF